MGDFFMVDQNGDSSNEMSSLKKCCSILIDSDRMLRSFFNLPLKASDTFDGFLPIGRNHSLNLSRSRNRSFSASPSRKFNRSGLLNDSNSMLPDHTLDDNGDLILTPYGRLEVCQFTIL
ncbi:hypothetical protein Ciccas_007782 [Cichlidogyrus casuarinus]|uniref:Uncharacterized protein n=1 Tax=Cichlidogyrus casuarinus TaxID=1844966 RepID=A0ABD2Q4I8_9PLAT